MKDSNKKLEELQLLVEDAFGVPVLYNSRKRVYVNARICFTYIARKELKYTFEKISKFLNKNPASILYYNNSFDAMLKTNQSFEDNFYKIDFHNIEPEDLKVIKSKIKYYEKKLQILNQKIKDRKFTE
jgi:chromosomal replication initiation ATPase DnaA